MCTAHTPYHFKEFECNHISNYICRQSVMGLLRLNMSNQHVYVRS